MPKTSIFEPLTLWPIEMTCALYGEMDPYFYKFHNTFKPIRQPNHRSFRDCIQDIQNDQNCYIIRGFECHTDCKTIFENFN